MHSVSLSPYISPLLRLRSAYHRVWYEMTRGIKWPRRRYHEQPAEVLPESLTPRQQHRIEALREKYGVRFEEQFHSSTALENYEYLDLFDQIQEKQDWKPCFGQELIDVGSLNFYYASALHAFFHPKQLQGIELEGYRVYTNFYSRFDYAQCYIRRLSNTTYSVMDFCDFRGVADGITCFYPFVKPEPLVAWRLPLKVFRPHRLFENCVRTLRTGGFLLMINHGKTKGRGLMILLMTAVSRCMENLNHFPHCFHGRKSPSPACGTKLKTTLPQFLSGKTSNSCHLSQQRLRTLLNPP